MAAKKRVALSTALGFTKGEALETVENLKRAGLIPADLELSFVTAPGGGNPVGSYYPIGSTPGARYLARDGQ